MDKVRTMDGIHNLERPVRVPALKPLEDKIHVGCVITCQSDVPGANVYEEMLTICLLSKPKPNEGVQREGRVSNPRKSEYVLIFLLS